MKSQSKILLFAAILGFAQFSQASTSIQVLNAPIEKVAFDAESLSVKIDGVLPNDCAFQPQPSVEFIGEGQPLMLVVNAYQVSEVCTQAVGRVYNLAFDVRSLKFQIAELNLDPNATYKFVSPNGDVVFSYDFKDSDFSLPYASDVLVGRVQKDSLEDKYVLVTPRQVFELNSPIIGMTEFIGRHVEVQGHILNIRIAGTSLIKREQTPASIIVTGINTTSY